MCSLPERDFNWQLSGHKPTSLDLQAAANESITAGFKRDIRDVTAGLS